MAKEENECVNENEVWIITPFERPDVSLVKSVAKAGAFPVLHLGRCRADAESALNKLAGLSQSFGVCALDNTVWELTLPDNVSRIIVPWGMQAHKTVNAEIVWQVRTAGEVEKALELNAKTLILKGCEGAGFCGEDSSFILFQKVIAHCKNAGAVVLIQGGVGVHAAAAYIALGAAGVVMDSQVALFPECGLSQVHKTALGKLSGNEIRISSGYHYYVFPGPDVNGGILELDELFARILKPESDVLPLGQDIILATDLSDEYKRLKHLVKAIKRSASVHMKQAMIKDYFAQGCDTAETLGTAYPVIQGPMARISDVPGFLRSIADGGALPFFAMGMMRGQAAADALNRTAEALKDKPWGVGILGFTYPKALEEQTKIILEAKPPFVLIAGGHPSQGKVFEKAGIKVLLHAPAPGLLDLFLKDGVRSYIFEGRESGGHIGPLFSAVLWEKQINRILKMENLSELSEMCAFFAGGIHDALSAAFVRVMASPLTARGMKVGLLCGTAYLFTDEARRYGAVSENYQKQLIDNDRTLVLKSGGGQETRCIPSRYTDFFFKEKIRLEKEGLETGEIILKLEAMNLGRLRIASKGLERVNGELVSLSEQDQLDKGLYMAGAITSLSGKIKSITDLHEDMINGSLNLISKITISEPASAPAEPSDAAVIGMAGVFPGASDIDEFWRNIIFGRDYVTEVPKERWPADLFYNPDTKDTDYVVSKWGGFIDKVDFDALEFGITPQSLTVIEPVQLLSLLAAKRALEDAGFTDLAEADLDDTAVIFGAEAGGDLSADYGTRVLLKGIYGELPKDADESLRRLTEDSFPGVLGNLIAGRISNRLNTGGRNFTVDAACASSLAALDIAMNELNSKKAGMVILGGADFNNGILPFLLFSSTYALSPKGRCATFDMDADGIAISEGVGVVILKRLEDAERDGNKILAVIKGSGGSSDGKCLGLTAPNRIGQIRALEQAYESAGVRPSDVGLIEAHGTGTDVGDRVELRALTDVFLEDGARPGQTYLSSLKSQIGHTKGAAGVAGLIKAVNCVRHGILPRTHHLKHPNEVYNTGSPFAFRTEKAGYWRAKRRIAGVSGFGFGGVNFHAVVENYEPNTPEAPLKIWPSELFVFPGETAEEADALMGKVKELLSINNKLRLRDIAYSLAQKYVGSPVQYVIIAGTQTELLARIDQARKGVEDENIYRLKPVAGKVAFLFPGQGSQRVNMAADLFIVFLRMRRLLDGLPEGYERVLFPDAAFTEREKDVQSKNITDTRNAQPLIGIVDLAVAELLREFGVNPDMAAGHSYGEIPALCFAGAFDSKYLTDLSLARAEAILESASDDPGCMAAVFTESKVLNGLLDGQDDVWAVNYNAPKQIAVAGTNAGMEAFLKKAELAGITCKKLNTACAFHSPLLKDADKNFVAALRKVSFNAPELPVWSNTTTELYPLTADEIIEQLAAHLVNPVKFTDEIKKMNDDGATVFIEAGPGGTLCKLVNDTLKNTEITVIQTERNGEDGLTFFLQALAKYISTGRTINMNKLFEGREPVMLNIDEPALHKKGGVIWNINGQAAVPENSEMPSSWRKTMQGGNAQQENKGSVEQIMMAYLENMNALIQDQRDVMLGYLGASEITPRTAQPRRGFTMPEMQDSEAALFSEVNSKLPEKTADDGLLDISSITSEQITNIIFEIVSEKTGYPIDMLNLDMDLEADLSIDSIKKMEIISGLRSRVKLPEGEENSDAFFEKIISIKKFRDLAAWIEDIGRTAASAGTVTGETPSEYEGAQPMVNLGVKPPSETAIIRMTLTETLRPVEKTDAKRVAGKAVAVTDDGCGLAIRISQALKAMDASPYIIADKSDNTELSGIDGLILINSSLSANRFTVMDLFGLLKRVDMSSLQWLLVFDDTSASAESGILSDLKQSGCISELPQGFPGFLKSLSHEYPGKRISAVQFETLFDPETFSGIVMDELIAIDPIPEVFYRDKERFLMLPKIGGVKTGSNTAPRVILDDDSVVVVLGGAQGITSQIAARMAREIPCRYILIGRSAEEPEFSKYKEYRTVDEIRRHLIERENMKNPREIEFKARRIYKSCKITASVAQIEQAGGKAEYISTDVTDSEVFDAALTKIKEGYGRIDGVIHAAGILEDKLFRDKDAESFERVYNTKTMPLKTILNRLFPELKLLVLFSSMAASFGNAGQCDYAAGNSALDRTARILKCQKPSLNVIAFDWGPWKGAGMVNEGLENEFNKKGISFIELDKGGEFFMNELKYGNETTVLAIASDERAILDFLKIVSER